MSGLIIGEGRVHAGIYIWSCLSLRDCQDGQSDSDIEPKKKGPLDSASEKDGYESAV